MRRRGRGIGGESSPRGAQAGYIRPVTLLSKLLGELKRARSSARAGGISPEEVRRLVESGRGQEAEVRLRNLLGMRPDDPDLWHLLGLVHHLNGDHQEAARLIERALEHLPGVAFIRANLAAVYAALRLLDRAEAQYRLALELGGESADMLVDLARVVHRGGRAGEALGLARQALEIEPLHSGALMLEASFLAENGQIPQAIARLKSGAARAPALEIKLFRLQEEICDWSQDRARLRSVIENWANEPANPAFEGINPFIAWHIAMPESIRLAVTQSYAQRLINEASGRRLVPSSRPSHRRRLRVGYLSADFHNHPTMHLMRGMFGRHNRERFEIFAYSLGPDDASAYRRQVIADTEHFADIGDLAPVAAARRIHADAIDVLIDLKGFTLAASPGILARRAAPVQITWLGYPATIGSGLADYAIVDRIVAPAAAAAFFGEKLIRMPHCYQVNDDGQEIAAGAVSRSEFGLPPEGFVFACFNNSYKIEPDVFDAWMRILARVPGSVLWLFRSNIWCEANLRREAKTRGVDPARLVFADARPKPEHLARLRLADLILDTFLYNAHTSASDALWAGVPLVTRLGDGFPARVAASVLEAARLPQLVSRGLEEYVELAVRLASRPAELEAIKEHLSSQRLRLPLFDTGRFVRHLESAIETAWRRHVEGRSPEHFAVAETPC